MATGVARRGARRSGERTLRIPPLVQWSSQPRLRTARRVVRSLVVRARASERACMRVGGCRFRAEAAHARIHGMQRRALAERELRGVTRVCRHSGGTFVGCTDKGFRSVYAPLARQRRGNALVFASLPDGIARAVTVATSHACLAGPFDVFGGHCCGTNAAEPLRYRQRGSHPAAKGRGSGTTNVRNATRPARDQQINRTLEDDDQATANDLCHQLLHRPEILKWRRFADEAARVFGTTRCHSHQGVFFCCWRGMLSGATT